MAYHIVCEGTHWSLNGPVYRISLAARMSIILSHSEVLLGQNHRNLNCVSMHIFGVQHPKICIEKLKSLVNLYETMLANIRGYLIYELICSEYELYLVI